LSDVDIAHFAQWVSGCLATFESIGELVNCNG
jgi:hypothetical protein